MLSDNMIPLITPMNVNGTVDFVSLRNLIKKYASYELDTYIVFGLDSEFDKLTIDEAKQIIATIRSTNINSEIIMDISGFSLEVVIKNSKIATTLGIEKVFINIANLIEENNYVTLVAIEELISVFSGKIIVNIETSIEDEAISLDVVKKIAYLEEVIAISDYFPNKQKYNYYARNIEPKYVSLISNNITSINDLPEISMLHAIFPEIVEYNRPINFLLKYNNILDFITKNSHNLILKYCLSTRGFCNMSSRIIAPKWPATIAFKLKKQIVEIASKIHDSQDILKEQTW